MFFMLSAMTLEESGITVVTLSVLITVVESVLLLEPFPPQAAKTPVANRMSNFFILTDLDVVNKPSLKHPKV